MQAVTGWDETFMNDKIRGAFLGLAAGDLIGGPIMMAMELAASLLKQNGFNRKSIEQHYLSWWKRDGFDSGPTAARVFQRVQSGSNFETAAKQVHDEFDKMTAGCNPCHRCLPISLLGAISDHNVSIFSKREACITHLHAMAGETAAAFNQLCRLLIKGSTWNEALDQAISTSHTEIRVHIERALSGSFNVSGYAPHAFATAVHFTNRGQTFDETLTQCISADRDANYVPVLAGALGGARWGDKAISKDWLTDKPQLEKLTGLINRLVGTWS